MTNTWKPMPAILVMLGVLVTMFIMTAALCGAEQERSPEDGPDFLAYQARKYAVSGPYMVMEVKDSGVKLFANPQNIFVPTAKKNVVVRDWYGKQVSKSELKPKKNVYVVRKGKEIIFFLDINRKHRDDVDKNPNRKNKKK